ncbi:MULTISPECIES: hypothetical protein [unclassified Paraburkholderia]|uniref:hypothetical protein n=1 Tax=unclassified Paraburkholderia TaxID=2615204 RepID=UPI0011B25001|nr:MULTISPECIES: hypothetical protein [unclassified Paraburkholderia]
MNLRSVQGIVRMRKKFGDQRLDAACERVLASASPKYRTVKAILDKRLDSEPAAAARKRRRRLLTYLNGGRFGRDVRSLLLH